MEWKQRREPLKKIKDVIPFLLLGIIPLYLHCINDIILEVKIECVNYYAEIYFFNVLFFAYYVCCFNKTYILNNLNHFFHFLIFVDYIASTIMYGICFYEKIDLRFKEKSFICQLVIVILNLVITWILIINSHEKDTEMHNSENRYEKYSENRYEKYLLERIDKNLNLIKNSKSEVNEEKSNDALSSEELINGSDILAEMLKNHIEIKEYFRISKSQSKFSFYFSIVSSVVGIIVVIIAAFGIVFFNSLEISIIAAVSGAVTEIISGIVLWIHNKSAMQLNYYYDSLHENEKFLSAVNIADKLSEGKKEDMYIEIIRKQIDIQEKDRENKVTDSGKE